MWKYDDRYPNHSQQVGHRNFMSRYLSYFAPAISFLVAVVSLLGPSRASGGSGISAITPFGWLLASLATISLGVTLFTVYSREKELAAVRAEKARLREVAFTEVGDGLGHLMKVLRYAALMPYTTIPRIPSGAPKKCPFPDSKNGWGYDIDFRSKETLSVLENLYLAPGAHLKSPYIPAAVPFGTDITRPSMKVISEESSKAAQMFETVVQKYVAVALPVDVIEASSAILRSPFLAHLISLRESWEKRSAMEDSNSPTTLNFRFLNSGITGGYTKDYFELLDNLDELRAALNKTK